jgi:glutaredoxin
MKKILLTITIILFSVFTISVKAEEKEKVKVYVFEAGGCPFCERELDYLKSLSSYGEKFEVIEKELYIDHIKWEEGKDYVLGRDVAIAFSEKGFYKAAYNSTPFVVISDIYASSGYNENLEEIINKAYEEGDRDIVGCYEKDLDVCKIRKAESGPFDKEYVAEEITYYSVYVVLNYLFSI